MDYITAIIIVGIAVPFFLIYLSKQFQGDNWYLVFFKILLYGMALYMLVLPQAQTLPLLDYSNQTDGMDNATYTALRNMATSQLDGYYLVLKVLVSAFFIYIIFIIAQWMRELKNKKDFGNGGMT